MARYHYGDTAMLEAEARAKELERGRDMLGCVTWHRILDAIHQLHAAKPAEGEKVH